MKKYIPFLVCLTSFLCAEIYQAKNWDDVQNHIEQLNRNDLAVFDVDYTLIAYVDPIFLPQGRAYYSELLFGLTKEQIKELQSVVDLNFSAIRLMDPKSLEVLEALKASSIKTIALTAQRVGSSGYVDNLQEWRERQLKSVGIDFSHFRGSISYPHLEAGFYNGILSSANSNKGTVLLAFLDSINFKPNHVFFMDDRLNWVNDVADALNQRGIPNTCVHFRLIESFDQPLDKEVAKKQFEILLKEKRWVVNGCSGV